MSRHPPIASGGGGADTNGLILVGTFNGNDAADWDPLSGISTDANDYVLAGTLVAGAGAGWSATLRMNGATTNWTYRRNEFPAAGAPGNGDTTNGIGAVGASEWLHINQLLIIGGGASAPGRRAFGNASAVRDAGGTKYENHSTFEWAGAANGTSFGFHASAGVFAAASSLTVWRRPRS